MNEYYNSSQKNKYIEMQPKIEKLLPVVFKKSAPIERLFEKDVSDFSKIELKVLFEKNGWILKRTFYNKRLLLSGYIQWVKGEDAESPINNFEYEQIAGEILIPKFYFKNIDGLKNFVSNLIDGANKNVKKLAEFDIKQYYMYFSSLYLLWYGMTKEDIINCKKSDINFSENKIMLSNGESISIDQDVIEMLNKSCNLTSIYVQRRHRTEVYYEETNYLIRRLLASSKGYNDAQVSDTFFRRLLVDIEKIQKFIGIPDSEIKKIELEAIYNSGLFYRYKFGNNIDLEQLMYRFNLTTPTNEKWCCYNQKTNFLNVYKMWNEYYYKK